MSYILKVRAASVLRKANDEAAASANNRSEDAEVSGGGGRSQEVMALERMVEALNTKIGDLGLVSGYFSAIMGTIHKGRPHQGGRGGWPKSRHSKGGCLDLVL